MFCDHVNRWPPGRRLVVRGGFVVCPECAAECRGCDAPHPRAELDPDGLCPACSGGVENPGAEAPELKEVVA